MYKIVVVDDELWFREGIKGSIQWSNYDTEIIGEACDGEEALEVIERERPDIVFADIRMPVMDGLELASIVVDKYPETKLIIVSGYEEFEYAREAMSLGVSYYLTKPVDAEHLIDIVNKVKEEIRLDREDRSSRVKIEEQLRQSLPLLREKFLNNLLNGEYRSKEEIESKLEFLGINLNLGNYITFVIDIDYYKPISNYQKERDRQYSRISVFNILKELICEEKNILSNMGFDDNILGIATFTGQISEAVSYIQISRLFDIFRGTVRKKLNLSVTIGVSRLHNKWDMVNCSLREAYDAIKHRLFLGKDQVIFFHDIAIDINREKKYEFFEKDEFIDSLKLGNMERAISVLNENLREIKKRNTLDYDYIQQIYQDLLGEILRFIHDTEISTEKIFDGNPFRKLLEIPTLEDINLWFISKVVRLTELVSDIREHQKRNIIDRVLEYIYTNYSKDISLNSAAEYIFLSPSYLSRLFKKETGKSFIQYIMDVRVKKAKELLIASDKKIYEIANEVGYTDMGYFAKMFKALEGISPAQYREKE